MNIGKAKIEIKNTINAYLKQDEDGLYEIPVEKQRPILLMGPPGIGKTAIMEQIAHEMGINLVSYTITHHTRQSAIGLPFIVQKSYGGEEHSVTEYTMSEIIAAIYDQIEKSGIDRGILFLDEINCVSETLAPTMLQFLQYKTFGSHKVPDGFVIVTAGNPAEYNRSVRDFDIVTLDRVKRIDIEADFEAWKNYAYEAGVHGAIMSYLNIKPRYFYSIRQEIESRCFVTARGWEDLSRILKVYEKQGNPIDGEFVAQYIQDPEIAADFADYYALYEKYRDVYKLDKILEGIYPEDTEAVKRAPFAEKLSLVGLMTDSISRGAADYCIAKTAQEKLFESLKTVLGGLREKDDTEEALEQIRGEILTAEQVLKLKRSAGNVTSYDEKISLRRIRMLKDLRSYLAVGTGSPDPAGAAPAPASAAIKGWFADSEAGRQQSAAELNSRLDAAFGFIDSVYGESQEMVIFITELSSNRSNVEFIADMGNENYYKYNKLLLLNQKRDEIKARVLAL